jgi:predicted nucleotidyltransferase
MPQDRFISAAMWNRIDRELDALAQAYDVRILLAVESGSRAWRFPSADSDYDVRFIYMRRPDVHLSIESPRDVIDGLQRGLLDVNGWDIRKALQMLVRSNAVLLEWLTSPVRYRDAGATPAQLLALARETCYLPAVEYHYDRLARRSFNEISSAEDTVRLKAYCYAVRPVLALRWLRRHDTAPPMDVPSLLEGIIIADDRRRAIASLIERKAAATERDTAARLPALDSFIAETLAQPVDRFALPDRAAVLARADALFAALLRGDALTAVAAPADG